eukprot:GEMP01072907.1.p1 GENE.GEMP01072907.1~~GEMP01072907.1.p1  ORF type:complete len:225 (+),score=52.46 GEMP01072907.1:163-837(+)
MDPYSSMGGNMMHYPQMNMQGQPQPNGQPNETMVPQFSFRTMLRFVTEMVAVIQGVAMIMAMVTGWLKDQQTGEPGPVGKFFAAVKKRLWRLIFGASSSNATLAPFDRAWASAPQRPPLSWTQRIIGLYLAYAIILEVKNYWQAVKNERMVRIRQPTDRPAQNAPNVMVTPPPPRADGNRSEPAANNLLEFYVNKQRELYQQKKSQEEVENGKLDANGGSNDIE